MTVMYPARVARFDLLKCVCFLAKRITRWDLECDRRLHRLIGYVAKTADDLSYGWIGDLPEFLTAHLSVDASLADCPYTLKSEMGTHFDIQGPNSRFPIAGGANTQTSTANSSTCAEIGACNSGMKNRSEPAFRMLSVFLSKYHTPGDSLSGGTPTKQCSGLFDPPNRINDHYHSQGTADFIGKGPENVGKLCSSIPIPTGAVYGPIPR